MYWRATFEHIMDGLDQGHLNPKLEVPGLTCLVGESNPGLAMGGEHSSKELFEHLHMSPGQNEKIQCVKEETGVFVKVDFLWLKNKHIFFMEHACVGVDSMQGM
jgi:hypothetical protein